MGKWTEQYLGNLVIEEKKSTIQVQGASNFGEYPFFTSGDNVLVHDKYLVNGERLFLATGGKANIKFYQGKAAYSTDTYVIFSEKASTKYLNYYLINQLEFINSNLFTGSGLKHLQKNDFKKWKIKLPEEKPEQARIAEILSKADKSITQTEALIAKYQRIKTGLMQDLLTQGIDKHGNIRSKQTHRFVVKNGIEVPEEWEVVELSKLVIRDSPIVYGILMPGYGYENGIPVVKVKDIKNESIILSDLLLTSSEIANRYARSSLKAGDLLFTIRGTVGRCSFVPLELEGANITQDTARIRLNGINPYFVRYCFEIEVIKRYI